MSRRGSVKSSNAVDAEVANLFNLQNKTQFTNALLALRQRYRDDDLVNKIQTVFIQRHSAIVKSAKKFADAVKARYATANIPFHQLLMKARAHAKKHGLSEAEFAEFQRIYEQELSGTGSGEVYLPVTNLMKVLGTVSSGTDSYFNVSNDDMRNLQEILKLHETSKALHAQVVLQTLVHEPLHQSLHMRSTQFNRQVHSASDYVHPVVVALFAPKIAGVDSHFLLSNMAGIVRNKYEGKPLTTRPDYELFYNLVTDPNDVVCDTRSPVGDLLHRCNLQTQLWNSVLHLRNGQIYNPSLREFLTSVDVCRLNKHDNPDFVYGRHDGTVIKRLFSAFSFRPTIVATIPISSYFAYNPYSQSLRPTVTSIPMINVRVLSNPKQAATTLTATTLSPATIILADMLEQAQQYIEGNSVTTRATKVLYTNGLLVFYIDRRAVEVTANMTPFNVLRMPAAVAGLERIIQTEIELGKNGTTTITVGESKEVYHLTSAVVAECNNNNNATNNVSNVSEVTNTVTYIFDNKGGRTSSTSSTGSLSMLTSAERVERARAKIADLRAAHTADEVAAEAARLHAEAEASKYYSAQEGGAGQQPYLYNPVEAVRKNPEVFTGVGETEALAAIKKRGLIIIYQNPDHKSDDALRFAF